MATKKKAVKRAVAKKVIKRAAVKKAVKKAVVKKAIKKAIVKKAVKKAVVKKALKKKIARKPNPAFMKALTPSSTLGGVIGSGAVPRTEAVKRIWTYIKANGLQDRANRRMINADEKLRSLFGRDQVSMFDLAKILSKHLS
jgi:chromatin remodeling complex protein RSC6